MAPKLDAQGLPQAAPNTPPAVTPAFLRDVLQKSTAATEDAAKATKQATKVMADALTSLPNLLADASARVPPAQVQLAAAAAAADNTPGVPTSRDIRDRRVPDF